MPVAVLFDHGFEAYRKHSKRIGEQNILFVTRSPGSWFCSKCCDVIDERNGKITKKKTNNRRIKNQS